MIVDWAKNCERIFKTKKLTMDDAADRLYKYKQEFVYLQYLAQVKLYDEQEVYDEWKRISNRNAPSAIGEFNEAESMADFQKIYGKAKKYTFTRINFKEHLKPIKIYRGEVDFLNKLDVPLWVKQYWACLLFYYKFESQNTKRVQKSRCLNTWCMRQVTGVNDIRYGSHCQDRIAQCRMRMREKGTEPFTDYLKLRLDHYPTYKPNFLQSSGEVAYETDSVNTVDEFIKLIGPNMSICTECGKEFEKSSKTKRTVCDECYKKYRRAYNIQKGKDSYRKKKEQDSVGK